MNFPGIYALRAAAHYLLNAGPERIAIHALALGEELIDGLETLELDLITPRATERRGASVSFAHEQAPEIGRALAARGVYVRAADGRVRASTHLFNDSADVERYLGTLRDIVR